ncbi:murein hydrolase activator EnvC family protein [Croceicoccus sediminis]|uniref:murein hydrolase activator EnvC family protein n=1 Tax=Croceicoccus sediminis TaxID=2571150 RepID=UPI0011821AC5|nr:peptidoglycan DD-metalloendopeptidase family protein [Croceicoccus sediminis]
MRLRLAVLTLALLPAAAGAVTSTQDRLREVEAAREEAQRKAAEFADQARLIEDRGLKAEARARALAAEVAEAENRLEAAQLRAEASANRLAVLRDELAVKRAPLSRMMAGLQRLAQRPTLLLVMRPSSTRDFVRMRSMVAGMQPQIAAHTKELRGDLAEARDLAATARRAREEGERARADLAESRAELQAMGTRDRMTAEKLADAANEARREATLRGAQVRSIGALVAREERGERTLAALSALPVPTLLASSSAEVKTDPGAPRLPVRGEILAGFGERDAAGGRSNGLTIAPNGGAPVVAPLAGEVAFAGPFRGYGNVVILRNADGKLSLLAGLDRTVVKTGGKVRRGETVGSAPAQDPRILYELRQGRRAIHPLLAR